MQAEQTVTSPRIERNRRQKHNRVVRLVLVTVLTLALGGLLIFYFGRKSIATVHVCKHPRPWSSVEKCNQAMLP